MNSSSTLIVAGLALVIGAAAGFLAAYFFVLELRLNEQELSFQERLRRRVEDLEKAHSDRTQAAIAAVQAEYEAKLSQAVSASASPLDSRARATPRPTASATVESAPIAIQAETSRADPTVAMQPPPSPATPTPTSSRADASRSCSRARGAQAPLTTPAIAPQDLAPLQFATAVHNPDASYRQQLTVAVSQFLQAQPNRVTKHYIQPLVRLSQDSEVAVRVAAIAALGQLQSPKGLPALRRALRDADSDVIKAASQAIERFRGPLRPKMSHPAKRRRRSLAPNKSAAP
jgi:uncharacterized membrane-anchored protein YhcB (DUF1043 family)